MATGGTGEFNRLTMARKQSLAPFASAPTLSHISIIRAQSSLVFSSLVAFSAERTKSYCLIDHRR